MTDIQEAIEDLRTAAREGAEYTVREELGLAADALEEAMLWIGAPVTGVAVPLILAKLGYNEKPEPSELHKKLDEALKPEILSSHLRETVVEVVGRLVEAELAKAVKPETNHGARYRAVTNSGVAGPERGTPNEALDDLKTYLSGAPDIGRDGMVQVNEPDGAGVWTTYAKNLSYWDIVHGGEG